MKATSKHSMFQSLRRIPTQIWVLGWASLFSDISTEMINSVLPVYVTTVLGASLVQFGAMEGLLEALGLVVKLFSGVVSDVLQSRKWLTILGYGLAALSKPFVPLANSYEVIFFSRIVDRMGKGIRGSPRDALIADHSPPEIRGASFGLRQGMDTAGAFVGPLLALVMMVAFHFGVKTILWVAVFPIWICVMVLIFFVREPKSKTKFDSKKIMFRDFHLISKTFWFLMLVVFVMGLGKFSDGFLLLKAKELGVKTSWIPMVMIFMNVIYAFSSYPLGRLSDRVGRLKLVGFGILLLIVADFSLSQTDNIPMMIVGVMAWALHLGCTQGVLSALVIDSVPESLRGTSLGMFYLVSGLGVLLSSTLAGWIWEHHGSDAAYLLAGSFAIVALFLLLLFIVLSKKTKHSSSR